MNQIMNIIYYIFKAYFTVLLIITYISISLHIPISVVHSFARNFFQLNILYLNKFIHFTYVKYFLNIIYLPYSIYTISINIISRVVIKTVVVQGTYVFLKKKTIRLM